MICVAAIAVLCWRMLHGIDFTDEAFYIALPLRFALGDRPFVDELNIAQTAGLLLYPFIKAYLWIAGGTTGIVLFIRALYVVVFGLVGWSAYALARRCIPRPAALLCGAMCMLVLPHGIPGLSYNTLSMALMTSGLFVIARALLFGEPPRRWWRHPLLWAGFAHGAATFAYPSQLVTTAATAIAVCALARGQRVRAVAMYAAGGLAFVALISPLFVRAGLRNLRIELAYQAGAGDAFSLPVAWARFQELLELHPQLPRALIAIVAVIVIARWLPLLAACGAVAIPLLARGSDQGGHLASMAYLTCFALFGPVLAAVIRERRVARVLEFAVIVPAMVSGAVICLSSSNRAYAAGIGLYPAAITTAILLVMFIVQTAARSGWRALHPYLALAPAAAMWALLACLVSDGGYYRDGPGSELTERVTSGPYRGLYTTPAKAEILRDLTSDIESYVQGPRALFLYDLPAGYLIAMRRPLVSSVWTFAIGTRHDQDVRLFKKWAKPGELVILDTPPWVTLETMAAERSDLLVIRPWYRVYRIR
ncbi:MAG TPA: hypothetical protein VF516_26565 [Kofleriaceae bacterium]